MNRRRVVMGASSALLVQQRYCASSATIKTAPCTLPSREVQHPYRGSGGRAVGLLRPTPICHFLPPNVWRSVARALAAGGLILFEIFLVAYSKEAEKLRREEKENGGKRGSSIRPPMQAMEAVQLLGLERVNPSYLTPANVVLPLTKEEERRVAKENFDKMMPLAMRSNNYFLAGKLSAAYRLCCDPYWDKNQSKENGEDDSKPKESPKMEGEG